MNSSSASAGTRNTLPRWFEWLAGAVLLLVAFGYFVVRPAADRLLQGVGGLVAVLATHAAEALTQTRDLACQAIEQDPAVQGLFAGQVCCAPVEEVTWLPPRDAETLEFEFAITSDTGQQGTAHVVAKMQPAGPNFESIVVSTDQGSVLLLPLP